MPAKIFKTCFSCKTEKTISEFRKNSARKDGLDVYCRICTDRKKKERYEKKPELKKKAYDKSAQWQRENPHRILEAAKRFRQAHAEKLALKRKTPEMREYNRLAARKRRQDPCGRLRSNVSRQITFMLKAKDGSKRGQSILKVLSYSISDLKNHLEALFDENMSWDNYGSYWHIDHIYPHSLLPYSSMDDENFKKCWALENLRPLEAKANIAKGNKVIPAD